MDSLSSFAPRGQHGQPATALPPEVLGFDAAAGAGGAGRAAGVASDDDDFYEQDTALERDAAATPVAPLASPATAVLTRPLVIMAPRGPQPVRVGYTVAAVIFGLRGPDDDEEPILGFQYLHHRTTLTLESACLLARAHAFDRSDICIPRATHIVVNDQTGKEFLRIPLVDAAAMAG